MIHDLNSYAGKCVQRSTAFLIKYFFIPTKLNNIYITEINQMFVLIFIYRLLLNLDMFSLFLPS